MSDLRIGIVGLGWVAGAHIETFKHVTGAQVTAVCSRRTLDPAALEAQYGLPLTVYRDYGEMLADPSIDVVDICTPHPLHAEQAIAAARAGKHLIIEKPIALSWRRRQGRPRRHPQGGRPGHGVLRGALQRAVHAGACAWSTRACSATSTTPRWTTTTASAPGTDSSRGT